MLAGGTAWATAHTLTPLAAAIVVGVAVGNLLPAVAPSLGAGVGFSKQTLLRLGVILYGFRLTLSDIGHIGLHGVLTDAVMLTSTFALAWFVGARLLKIERRTVLLIGAGSSICGAAAVLATEPVVEGESQHVAIAIATVLLFGSSAIFLYPALYRLNLHWQVLPTDPTAFGIYAGSTIHEVAQVFAAAHAVGAQVADTAVITKMVRVMMLAPFLLILSVLLRTGGRWRERGQSNGSGLSGSHWRRSMPWFALWFMAVVALNSLLPLPVEFQRWLAQVDTLLLAAAMAALGLSTSLGAICRAGIRPMLLGGLLFLWLIAGGALVNRWL